MALCLVHPRKGRHRATFVESEVKMIRLGELEKMTIKEFLNSPYYRELSGNADILSEFLMIARKAIDAKVIYGDAVVHNWESDDENSFDVASGYFELLEESKNHIEIEV